MIATAPVLKWLEIASRDLVSYVSDKVSAITTAGWVLVAIGGVALIWAWAIMHASTRLGPIEVDDLKIDGTPQVPLLALTAAFRQRLWRVGLAPPPAVPEGAPQANLIKAVEAVAPEGTAIGKLLELLPTPPKPPEYKLKAILTGSGMRCGVSYTLQPLARGATYLHTVDHCSTHARALDRAAVDIYQHIAKSLPEVFPPWVRWRTTESLDAYLAGCDWRRGGDMDQAATMLTGAVEESPFNALAALQLANLDERRAAASEGWGKAYFQAQAMARYWSTAVMWPSIAEARYRASVVSSGLASTYRDLTSDEEKVAIRKIVPVGKDDAGYVDRLRNFADRESSATVQLLNPLYALVRQQRLRNQFESKGRDRRELRDGVRISRHCVRIRRLNQSTPRTRRFRAEATFRATAVWLLTKKELAWQARYNVACFDALRLAGPYVPPERRSGVKERALRNLDQAIRESAGELTRLWIEEDPDMAYFRGETDDDEQD